MTSTVRAVVQASVVGALMVCAVVQDRVTAAGARQYVTLQSAALSGSGSPVTIDAVMAPAVRDSVRRGLLWGGLVLGVGLAGAASVSKRARRE
jgi:hypothetical protein